MVFTQRSLLNVNERILLYLLNNSFQIESPDASGNMTAFGIANAVLSDRNNILNNIKRLKNLEYLDGTLTHIKGKKRKQRIYNLTDIGRKKANEIKEDLINKEITILNSDQNIMRLKFPEVSKYIEENEICQEITDLEICKLTNYKNILDVNLISKIKQNYTHFIDDALKPKYFFGRVKELYQLKKLINNKNLYKMIVIYGIAGIGKTSLVSKLIKDYMDFKNISWYKCNKWDTVRSILLHLTQFLSKTNDDYLKLYINFSKPLDRDKILYLLKKKMKDINTLFIFDDFKCAEHLMLFFK